MKRLLTYVRTNDFIRHNGIFFIGSLAVAAVNYLYYPVLGRLMPTTQFGEVQVLVSLFLEATIFFGVVTNVAVNIVANEDDVRVRNRIVLELERFVTILTIVAVIAALLFAKPLQSFFQFPEVGSFFILGLVLIISAPNALRGAYLRGRSAFGALSINNFIGSVGKLFISVGLVVLGFGTKGAIGGLVVAQLLSLVLARRQAAKLGLHSEKEPLWKLPDMRLLRPHLSYALLVLIVSLITTVLFSFDVLVAKHYFSAQMAGEYAGISTIARIIYFLTGSIAIVLLSNVRLTSSVAQNHSLLKRSVILQTAIGGPVLLLFVAAPKLFITLLIGHRYLVYANLLPLLSITLFVLAFVNLFLNYDLALRRWSAAWVTASGAVSTGIFVLLWHDSPHQVVMSILWGSLVMGVVRAGDSIRRRI